MLGSNVSGVEMLAADAPARHLRGDSAGSSAFIGKRLPGGPILRITLIFN